MCGPSIGRLSDRALAGACVAAWLSRVLPQAPPPPPTAPCALQDPTPVCLVCDDSELLRENAHTRDTLHTREPPQSRSQSTLLRACRQMWQRACPSTDGPPADCSVRQDDECCLSTLCSTVSKPDIAEPHDTDLCWNNLPSTAGASTADNCTLCAAGTYSSVSGVC